MRTRIRTSVVEALRFALALLLCLIISGGADILVHTLVVHAATFTVNLSADATPLNSLQNSVASVTGSNFPPGISAANTTVTLKPVTPGDGPTVSPTVTSAQILFGSEGKISFQIPTISLSGETPYRVSVSGTTPAGNTFASSNTAAINIAGSPTITLINPNTGSQGATETVNFTANNISLVQGSTLITVPGISVNGSAAGTPGGATITGTTTGSVVLKIPTSATIGGHNFVLQTGIQQASLVNGFTVTATALLPTTTTAASETAVFSESSQTVPLTAAVTSPSETVNSGSLTFTVFSGTTMIGVPLTVPVTNGNASGTYTVPANTPAGTDTILATYNPGSGFAGSSDNTHTLVISPAATTTIAGSESAQWNPNTQTFFLPATVTSPAGPVNSGTVTFTLLQGTLTIGAPVTSGTVAAGAARANFTLPGGTAPGIYTIKATYNGTINLQTSTDATHTVTITPATTRTTLPSESTPFSTSSQALTIPVTVTSPAGTVNQGTVMLKLLQGTTLIGSPASALVVNGSASESFTLPGGTATGTYTFQASFSGGTDFQPSNGTGTLSLGTAPTTTAASNATATFSDAADAVTVTANVTSPDGTVNTGTVTFELLSGATVVAGPVTGSVANGVASASVTVPAVQAPGTYEISAAFGGGGGFAASTDTRHTLVINQASTTTTVANVSATSATSGQTLTLNATVTSPAGPVNGGTVTFTVSGIGTPVTSGTVAAGAASANFTLPGGVVAGTTALIAGAYSGTSNFGASSGSGTLSVTSASGTATAINLQLVQFILTAGTSTTFTDVPVDASGNPVSGLTPTCLVTADPTSTGTAPTVGTGTIGTSSDTRGVYTLTCKLTSPALSSSSVFTVLPPTSTTVTTTQQANFALFSNTTTMSESLLGQINAGINSGNQAAVNTALNQLQSALSAVDFDALDRSMAFAPVGGFPADPGSLPGFGINPTAADANVGAYVSNLTTALQNLTTFLQQNPLATLTSAQQSQYASLRSALSTLASQLPTLNPSAYGIDANSSQIDYLFSDALPQYYRALVQSGINLAVANGYSVRRPNRNTFLAQRGRACLMNTSWHPADGTFMPAALPRGTAFQFGFAFLMEDVEIDMDFINKIYGPFFAYIAKAAIIMEIHDAFKAAVGAINIDGLVSGASQSFFVFGSGGSEIDVLDVDPILQNNKVYLVGPDQINAVGDAISYLQGLHVPTDLNDFYDEIQGFVDLFKKVQCVYNEMSQPPDFALGGGNCLTDPGNNSCTALTYNNGLNSVYNPNGPAIPAPVLIFVNVKTQGAWSIGEFNFIPSGSACP